MAVRLFEGRDHAAAYLQYRVTPGELIDIIMSYMGKKTPNQCNLAVDVGCGSGQGTILLAPHFAKVVGTDISPAQLEMALTNEKPPNVSYRECPAEELPFACGEVDLVSAFAAAHWFDQEKFLLEVDRVLRPGGCLALLSYSTEMELEYEDVPDATLNGICRELHAGLQPFKHPHIGATTSDIYSALFESCPYPDKEWTECRKMKRSLPLSGYMGMVETFSSFQVLLQEDPTRAQRLSNDIRNKFMCAMKASSPETEVMVIVKFFYCLARKPL
ncbi:putative methyltransferase [Liparis tanakae]|uniref:Putative methyltransferase n=1 Tax=Liparis tanakae TaxID=230148 RepID=A0A4Z2FA80_9TELE|nr:putative methyltransferase [Liparis tanakae]